MVSEAAEKKGKGREVRRDVDRRSEVGSESS